MNSQTATKLMNALTLFGAAEEGNADAAARLLDSGAFADERRAPGGETPLMRAAARGHEDVVRLLLDAGADANARRADGFTPLILAVFFGHEAVASLLVERGADANARTSLGTTAVRWAEARGFASMAKVLREAEASGVFEKQSGARAKAVTKPTHDEIGLFSRRIEHEDFGGEGDTAGVPLSAAQTDNSSSSVTATDDSVRRGGGLPVSTSASAFRVRDFLRSWPGALGALLLLGAFGVAVFALVQRGSEPRAVQPAPRPGAPQAATQQTPAPLLPTPEPAPAFPTPDPQGAIPVPDQTYAVPNTTGQPYYVSPGPVSPVTADAPNELTVVSESGAPATRDAGQAERRANANGSAPARNDNSASAPRTTRTPESEPQRPAAPAPSPNQPPPSAPQPTPRAKVIQWPPQ